MVRILDPRNLAWWDSFVADDPEATIFHGSAWARVLADTYGFIPRYFVGEGQTGWCVVPMMEIRGIFARRHGVGLPFSDAVSALGARGPVLAETTRALADFAARRGWRSLEFRDSLPIPGAHASKRFVHHQVRLDDDVEAVGKALHESIRRNIRKAERSGVRVSCSRDGGAMEGFYRLHCLTRRKHGLPPQPLIFFRNLWRELIDPGRGFVACAWHGGRLVSAAVFLHFGSSAIYKYGASLETHHHLRANHLVMWRSIQKCMQGGCRLLSLGRTDLGQEGLIRYKQAWGAEEKPNPYTRTGSEERKSTLRTMVRGMIGATARRMPIPVLRVIGEIAYRHIA
jgi:hypothetical protein